MHGSILPFPQYVFLAWCLVKRRNSIKVLAINVKWISKVALKQAVEEARNFSGRTDMLKEDFLFVRSISRVVYWPIQSFKFPASDQKRLTSQTGWKQVASPSCQVYWGMGPSRRAISTWKRECMAGWSRSVVQPACSTPQRFSFADRKRMSFVNLSTFCTDLRTDSSVV
jgi:hypothetical protein